VPLALYLTCGVAHADESLVSRLNVYKDAIDAIGAAGDAIAKLTDGVKHLVVTGAQGYDYVAAKRDHDRLRDISARATDLAYSHNAVVISSIDAYLALKHPTPGDWHVITEGTQRVIDSVKVLLDDVRNERSDFVLEDAYGKLAGSLQSRGLLLGKLAKLPAPKTAQERAALRQLNAKYKVLLANFEAAIAELNLYLKTKPAASARLPTELPRTSGGQLSLT
jgi:hypothetical protein